MRVFVKSFGCSANLADGAVLAGSLRRAGYDLVNSVSAADVTVYNTCGVKGPTENRVIEVLKRVPTDRKLIVAGCLPLINFERLCKEVRFDGTVGPAIGEEIVEIVERVFHGEKVIALETEPHHRPGLSLPRLQLSPVTSIIPINYGCLGSCAYCCVVFARGKLRSYTVEEIAERFRQDLAIGLREFWLTSQDTGCYGKDIGTNLAELLNALCKIEGAFKIRVGMMTSNTIMDTLKDLIQAFKNKQVFKFIHLPMQSGDDEVLRRMRRFYSVDDFKRLVDAFRASFPQVTLATDVICGFPGESKEAFERTLRLLEEIRPDVVNVSKFFARPKTPAASMHKDFIPLPEIKQRSTSAGDLAQKVAFEQNRRWLGWEGEILVDEAGKISGSWVGRNLAYKPVVVHCRDPLLGKTLNVKVVETFSTYLCGEIVE